MNGSQKLLLSALLPAFLGACSTIPDQNNQIEPDAIHPKSKEVTPSVYTRVYVAEVDQLQNHMTNG